MVNLKVRKPKQPATSSHLFPRLKWVILLPRILRLRLRVRRFPPVLRFFLVLGLVVGVHHHHLLASMVN